MFPTSYCKFFVLIAVISVAIIQPFFSVNTQETSTSTPIDVEEVEAVDIDNSPSTAQAQTSLNNETDTTTGAGAYICSNSFDIKSLEEFKEKVLGSKKPIIVQFHAPWSQDCSTLTPRIGRAVDDKKGKIKLARVDLDKYEKIGLEVGIQLVPCIAAFRDGELIEKLSGLQEENNLKIFVGKYIADFD